MSFLNYKRWRQTAQAFMLAALLLPGMGIYAQTMNGNYPQEKLLDRIERIKKQTNKNIICDAGQLASVNAPALEADGISLEELLKRSVAHTNFTVEKVGASFAVRPVSGGASQQKGEKRGKLSGTVVDKNGFPVVGATVVVEGLSGKGTATNLRGDFTIDGLPARIYTVKISCISYQEMRISDIKIAGGKSTPLDVILQDASKELDEVVVTATYNRASANGLYAKQKAMVAMSDGISADLIKKTSDNNVAQVLRRVSGVTIDNGKYVTVRGMGERYNNVQLNGATLPSTEPEPTQLLVRRDTQCAGGQRNRGQDLHSRPSRRVHRRTGGGADACRAGQEVLQHQRGHGHEHHQHRQGLPEQRPGTARTGSSATSTTASGMPDRTKKPPSNP